MEIDSLTEKKRNNLAEAFSINSDKIGNELKIMLSTPPFHARLLQKIRVRWYAKHAKKLSTLSKDFLLMIIIRWLKQNALTSRTIKRFALEIDIYEAMMENLRDGDPNMFTELSLLIDSKKEDIEFLKTLE